MSQWIYLNDGYKAQCPKCMYVIEHMRLPKRCPNCHSEMENADSKLFPTWKLRKCRKSKMD